MEARLLRSWEGRVGNRGSRWTVYNGDARAVLSELPADQFSCVVTSPPYFWQRDYDVGGQIGLEPSIDGYVQSVCDTMNEVKRVLKPRGVLFLNLGDTYYSGKGKPHGHDPKHNGRRLKVLRAVDTSGLGVPQKTVIGIPWRVALEMISRGWTLRAPIIWRREKALPEANALDRPWRTYEFHVHVHQGSQVQLHSRPAQVLPCRGRVDNRIEAKSRMRTSRRFSGRTGWPLPKDWKSALWARPGSIRWERHSPPGCSRAWHECRCH